MTNKTKLLLCAGFFCFLITLLSCQRDEQNQKTNSNLEVVFGTSSVNISGIDSAYVILKKTGAADSTKTFLQKTGNKLSASVKNLSSGNYLASFVLYSTQADASQRKYTLAENHSLGANNTVTVSGPTGKITDSWQTWIVQKQKGVTITIPLNFANPYFEIEVESNSWDYVYTDRIAYHVTGGTQIRVASQTWECGNTAGNSCFVQRRIRNATGFQNFSAQLQNQSWNKGEFVTIVMNTATGEEVLFAYAFNL